MNGFQVIASAYDGMEAVDTYSKLNPKPDIILMDYRMPMKDGVTATQEIRQMNPVCKIIFLSADETARESAMLAGASSFLIKPVRFAHLLQAINTIANSP